MAEQPRILVDVVHGRENNPFDFRHNRANYLYYHVYSMFRLFRHLDSIGFRMGVHRKGLLTPEILEQYDILFMNLIHENDPHFAPSELQAVHSWVGAGGSLLVITEHTNTYHSAEKINPLIAPLGIHVTWTTALDVPEHCTNAPGWLLVRHFDRAHPINAGVTAMHILSGSTLAYTSADFCLRHSSHDISSGSRSTHELGELPRCQSTAFTSPEGWADKAGTGPPSFYGDGKRSPEDESGSMPVVAVSEFGRGRMVVLGDQNIIGDAMLFWRHNFRHIMNCFEWLSEPSRTNSLLRQGRLAPPFPQPLRFTLPVTVKIGLDLKLRPLCAVKEAPDGLVGFYINLNRTIEASSFAISLGERELFNDAFENHGDIKLLPGIDDDDCSSAMDAWIIPAPTIAVSECMIERIRAFAAAGKMIILLMDVDNLSPQALDLLAALAPDFDISPQPLSASLSPSKQYRVADHLSNKLISAASKFPRLPLQLSHRLQSSELDMKVDDAYLQDFSTASIRSGWGRPFLSTNPHEVNVALGCMAYQSSEFEDRPCPAKNAVDGDFLTHAHTSIQDCHPWWVVDLGQNTLLTKLIIYNRADISQLRLRDLVIQCFVDEDNAGDAVKPCSSLMCQNSARMRCGKCQLAVYCCKDCQKTDWPHHKSICKPQNQLSPPFSQFGRQTYKSEVINPNNQLDSPTHITQYLPLHGIRARFIMISRIASKDPNLHFEDQRLLTIAQLVAISPNPPPSAVSLRPLVYNAALHCRNTSQSTTENQPAHIAVDGIVDSCTHTDSANDMQPWWQCDLGCEQNVRLLCLHNRMDGWMNRFRDLTIELADAQQRVVWSSDLLNPNNRLNGPAQINVCVHTPEGNAGVRAQFILIRRQPASVLEVMPFGDRNVLSLVQVQVWASPMPDPKKSTFERVVPLLPPHTPLTIFNELPSVDIARIGSVHHPNTSFPSSSSTSASTSSASTSSSSSLSSSSASTPSSRRDNLIVFLQSSFWYNRFTSSVCDRRCRVHGELAIKLMYDLVDFIISRTYQRRHEVFVESGSS